jgi:hypothetical protein
MMGRIISEWKRLTPYFSLLDFGAPPTTRIAWAVRVCVLTFALVVLYKRLDTTTAPLLNAKAPIPIPSEEIEDYRFRLPERTRREIFAEIAEAEQNDRIHAIQRNSWNGHLWSREDDRGHFERVFFRILAKRYNISLTQVYLILDEGIRGLWRGPDGQPLPPTTPPLNPRPTW